MNRILDFQRAGSGHRILGAQNASTVPIIVPPPGPPIDPDFLAWLESDDAIPNVLIETWALVNGVATPFYWSTCGYSTEGTTAVTHYEPVLSRGIAFPEALSITSGASTAASTLDIDNTDGIHEDWMAHTWSNQLVFELFGDLRWNRADYRRVSKGVSAGLVRKDDKTLALHLRDMTQRLSVPLSEHKLGGTSQNQDEIIPLCFGEVENVGGLLTNPATLERAFHDGAIKAIGEIRAAGLPVDVTEHLATGRCELTEDNGSAVITASIQGDNYGGVYRATIATIIRRIITGYGSATDRYTDADIDLDNFAAFDAGHLQPVGYYVDARENMFAVCDFLARSVGAQLSPTADGLLQLIQIALPASGTSTDIRPEHLVGPLRPVQHIDPIASSKIAFCRNYTVQETVAGGVPAVLGEMFKTEWLTATKVNDAAKVALNLQADPEQRNTALLRRVDADAEAARDLALWGPGRDIYEFDGLAPLLMLKIGQPVTVYDELFGMQAGRPGQILEITRDWDARRVTGRILV